jgi:protein-disulfide isomerase
MPIGSYEDQPRLGQADAPVTLYLFENYACRHCRTFEEKVMPQLRRDHIDSGQVQLVSINVPDSEAATTAAIAGLCVYEQDNLAYWAYKMRIYGQAGNDGWATKEQLVELAEILPVDTHELATCIEEARHGETITRNVELAAIAGVTRTPTVVIGDQGLVGTRYEPIRAAIEQRLHDE